MKPYQPADLEKAEAIKQHLQTHHLVDYDFKTLASACNTTQDFIKYDFKAITGQTFKQFVRNYKLELARQFFQQGYAVKTVSLELHYSTDHLCKMYKKKYGHSPTSAGGETNSNTTGET